MVTSNGYYATKHGVGVYGATPPNREWSRTSPEEFQKQLAELGLCFIGQTPPADLSSTHTLSGMTARVSPSTASFAAIRRWANEHGLVRRPTPVCSRR